MIRNPKPASISGHPWTLEAGINRFTVNIPSEPVDNDLAGVIIIAKAGGTPFYPADVVYKGPWADFLLVDTDADNRALLPNTSYTVGIAAYDSFGSGVDDVNFGSVTKSVTTAQVVVEDIDDGAVTTSKLGSGAVTTSKLGSGAVTTNELGSGAVTDAKVTDVSGSKLSGGAIVSDSWSATAGVKVDLVTGDIFSGGSSTSTQHIKINSNTGALEFYTDEGTGTYKKTISLDSGTSSAGDPTVSDFGHSSLDKIAAYMINNSHRPTLQVNNYGSGYAISTSGDVRIKGDVDIYTGDVEIHNGDVEINGDVDVLGFSYFGNPNLDQSAAGMINNSAADTLQVTNLGSGYCLATHGPVKFGIGSSIYGDLIPIPDGSGFSQFDLGAETEEWDKAYIEEVYCRNSLKMGPAGTVEANTQLRGGVRYIRIDNLGMRSVTVPSTASSYGVYGAFAYDSSYFYVCVATDTWKRVALSTW